MNELIGKKIRTTKKVPGVSMESVPIGTEGLVEHNDNPPEEGDVLVRLFDRYLGEITYWIKNDGWELC